MIAYILHCPHCHGTLAQCRGLTSELDEMWSYVGKKAKPRLRWHAIDHQSGQVLA